MKKYHAGRANQSDETWQVFADETRRADDQAFWLKVRDITQAAFNEQEFRKAVAELKAAGGRPITSNNLQAVVEATVEQLSLSPAVAPGILGYLAKGGDFTQWGLSSAITRVAGEVESYEEATQLERAGGAIIALAPDQWEVIQAAA
jgi:glucose-6-phosphate isomerase